MTRNMLISIIRLSGRADTQSAHTNMSQTDSRLIINHDDSETIFCLHSEILEGIPIEHHS
jgi:hypothetical protein